MQLARKEITRKDMLKMSLLGSAALLLPLERVARTQLAVNNRLPTSRLPRPFRVPFSVPPVLTPVRTDEVPGKDSSGKGSAAFPDGMPFVGTDYYEVKMQAARVPILPGLPPTLIFGYNGIAPGTTIKARHDRQIVIRYINELPSRHPVLGYEPTTSVHLHGSASKPQYDGYASDITAPGFFKDYVYPNFQDARTLWYHDHGVHHTAENAYMGLAAQYHLHDDLEDRLADPAQNGGAAIPSGEYDVPLILRDALFTKDGQLLHDDEGHSSLFGDVILTNGRPWPVMKVERRKYRFRVLNGSISRGFNLALSTGDPMTIIGHDGGLAPAPVQVGSFRIGGAERYEVVIDFSKYKKGTKVVLKNLGVKNSEDYPSTRQIMRFDVVGDKVQEGPIPEELHSGAGEFYNPMPLEESDATNAGNPVRLTVERKNGLWTVNGHTWDDVVESDFKKIVANPGLDEVQVWELENKSGGWFNPLHIHLVDYKILSRNGRPPHPYERGPKDTAYVGENETLRVIARFGPQKGKYMVHCHNLVHEDHDMMVQYEVGKDQEGGGDGDPWRSAPAKPVSEMTPL